MLNFSEYIICHLLSDIISETTIILLWQDEQHGNGGQRFPGLELAKLWHRSLPSSDKILPQKCIDFSQKMMAALLCSVICKCMTIYKYTTRFFKKKMVLNI